MKTQRFGALGGGARLGKVAGGEKDSEFYLMHRTTAPMAKDVPPKLRQARSAKQPALFGHLRRRASRMYRSAAGSHRSRAHAPAHHHRDLLLFIVLGRQKGL